MTTQAHGGYRKRSTRRRTRRNCDKYRGHVGVTYRRNFVHELLVSVVEAILDDAKRTGRNSVGGPEEETKKNEMRNGKHGLKTADIKNRTVKRVRIEE